MGDKILRAIEALGGIVRAHKILRVPAGILGIVISLAAMALGGWLVYAGGDRMIDNVFHGAHHSVRETGSMFLGGILLACFGLIGVPVCLGFAKGEI